jgi:hypothetical protein
MREVQTWPVVVGGNHYEITLSDSGDGKCAIRANGRIVARPFVGEGDDERTFNVVGAVCYVRRENDEFTLTVEPVVAGSVTSGTDSGASMLAGRFGVWIVIVGILLIPALWYLRFSSYSNVARRRVEAILRGMTVPLEQPVLGMWARDTRHLADLQEISWAELHFKDWRREKELPKIIKSWEVTDTDEVKGAEVPTVVVTVVIDSRRLAMIVPDRRPISWAQDPN